MTAPKVTDWFPASVNPVHVGVYETDTDGCFQHWNGKWFGLFSHSPQEAFKERKVKSMFQEDKWRGLTKRVR